MNLKGITYIYKREITIEDVYGKIEVRIPDEYKFKEFRPPKMGDTYIADSYMVHTMGLGGAFSDGHPRIILEKLPAKRRFIVEECGAGDHFGTALITGYLWMPNTTDAPSKLFMKMVEEITPK